MHGLLDLIHGGDVMDRHEVEAETVEMVFGEPVDEAVHHVLAEHCALGGRLVSAAASVGGRSGGAVAVVIVGDDPVEVGVDVVGVVVDHVHDHSEACLVKAHDHLLEFVDPDFAVVRVRAVASLGHVVVLGIVAPVELRLVEPALVNGGVVVDRLQVHMGDSQVLQVIDTHGDSCGVHQTCFGEGHVLAGVGRRGDPVGEIPYVDFPDHGIRIVLQTHKAVFLESGGVREREVRDHAAVAVDSCSACIRIHGFLRSCRSGNFIGVVGSVAAPVLRAPDALVLSLHGNGCEGRPSVSGLIELEDDVRCRGGPDLEGRRVSADHGAQVVAVVCVVFREVLRIEDFGGNGVALSVAFDLHRVFHCNVQVLCQREDSAGSVGPEVRDCGDGNLASVLGHLEGGRIACDFGIAGGDEEADPVHVRDAGQVEEPDGLQRLSVVGAAVLSAVSGDEINLGFPARNHGRPVIRPVLGCIAPVVLTRV